jgi:hypothetical protein
MVLQLQEAMLGTFILVVVINMFLDRKIIGYWKDGFA